MSKYPANDAKFEAVKQLDLPLGQYAITSSGPLGIREIREIGDIDLIVSEPLWQELAQRYPVEDREFKKINMGSSIEVIHFGSDYVDQIEGAPSAVEQIAEAEIIEGLPFVRLETILFFKERMGREKDQRDIEAIRKILMQ